MTDHENLLAARSQLSQVVRELTATRDAAALVLARIDLLLMETVELETEDGE